MDARRPLLDEMGAEMMKLLRTGDVLIYPDLVLTNEARAPRGVEATPLWDCFLRWREPARPEHAAAEPHFIGALLQVLSRLNAQHKVQVLLDPEEERVLVFPGELPARLPMARRVVPRKIPSFEEANHASKPVHLPFRVHGTASGATVGGAGGEG